jgi:murein endopeptidase
LESDALRIMRPKHRRRCLYWGTSRLVKALARAGQRVQRELPGSPPLAVGNVGRAQGGSVQFYSRSHQSGRDADVAFYSLDEASQPYFPSDLHRFDESLSSRTADGRMLRFDLARNWALVRALLEDPEIELIYLFIASPLKAALLKHARDKGEPVELIERASKILHQPTDALPHDDHLHVRITCTSTEAELGCSGGV